MTQPPNPPQPQPANATKQPMVAGAMQALLFGILAWVPCLLGVPGIVAAVFGHLALRELRRHPMLRGRRQAMAGLILGYSAAFLAVIWLIGWIIEQRSR